MGGISWTAVSLVFCFWTCALTQEADDILYDDYAPKYTGEENSIYGTGFNPDAAVEVEDNNYSDTARDLDGGEKRELGGYEPLSALDSAPSESIDYPVVSADVEGDKYPETPDNSEVSVVVEGEEKPELGGYQSADAADRELEPSETKDISEVSADVEGEKYPDTAEYPEVTGAEGNENPDLGVYQPLDKDSADVEGEKYPETAEYPEVTDAEGNENPDLGVYQPLDKDSADVEGEKYPETAEYPEVTGAEGNETPELGVYQPLDKDSADVEGEKYPETADNTEVAVGAERNENPDLESYQPSGSEDISEVSADVEGNQYPETAENPEVYYGAEVDKSPETGVYQSVDAVNRDELEPSESKDYSEVPAGVDDDKNSEPESYVPVKEYEPSLTKEYPEEVGLSDNGIETNVLPVPEAEGDKYPESELQPVDNVDIKEYLPSDSSLNPAVSAEVDPYVTKNYPEVIVEVEENEPYVTTYPEVTTNVEVNEPYVTTTYPEAVSSVQENEPYVTTSYPATVVIIEEDEIPSVPYVPTAYPEAVSDVDENEPQVTTYYPNAGADIEPKEPYVTTSSPEIEPKEPYVTTSPPDIEPKEPYVTTSSPDVVSDVDEPNGYPEMPDGTGTSEGSVEEPTSEEGQPGEATCNYDDFDGLADLLIRNVRPMIPNTVYLPDRRHGPFTIRSFFVRGVSRFIRSGQPAIACSGSTITLNIPLYWDAPLIGFFELSVASLMSEVKVALPRLEAEAIIDVHYTGSSTYAIYVRDVRFTRSSSPRVVMSNVGYFRRFAHKLASWMATIFQARIRHFLSGQFQRILQEQILKVEVEYTYSGYYY